MHTAPIANLPVHPTPAVARHESHDDDFSIHLRQEARENPRYEEPRPPQHNDPNRAKARPGAPEEDHQRLSSDGGTTPVAQPAATEKPTASQGKTDLPDTDTEAVDAAAPLSQSDAASQPVTTEPAALQPSIIELADVAADAADAETTPAKNTDPALTTAPVLALVTDGGIVLPAGGMAEISGGAEISGNSEGKTAASAPVPAAPAIDSDPDLPIAKASETSPASQTTLPPSATPLVAAAATNPVTDIPVSTPLPAASVISATPAPADINLSGQTAAATIMAAGGVRGGTGTQSQTGGAAAPADGLTIGTPQPGEADGETEIVHGSTGKAAGTTPTVSPAGQSAGATTSGAAAKAPLMAEVIAKEAPAVQEMAARGTDTPTQNNTSSVNQSSTTGTFGSELKLAGSASPATETAAARNLPNAAVNQVAVQINRAVQDGQDKFIVNLKPGTLGKVSVQLEVGHDNRIIAVIAAERPDTLELLQRDSRALELALKEAGLKADSGSLSFSLQGDGTEESPFDEPSGSNHAVAVPQGGDDLDTLPTQNTHAYATDASGVDIHV